MASTPNYDAKVKAILDATTLGERVCAITGEKWTQDSKELEIYRRFNVPPLKICTNALWKWMAFYDAGFQFWWNKHAETGKPVLSFHHPASGIRVLPDVEWHAKDFSTITADVDPTKSFFDQLRALELCVPFMATFDRQPPENSITLFSFGDRNSYFTFACQSERCFFSAGAFQAEGSSLLWLTNQITDSHWILKSDRLFRCRYVRESLDCIDSAFLFDCRNCQNCFGVVNKRNRQYLFMNEQLSRAEYEARMLTIDLGKRSEVEKYSQQFDALLAKEGVWPENFNVNTQESVGEYLVNAVRSQQCFAAADAPTDQYRSAWSYGLNQHNANMWGSIDSSDCYMSVACPNSSKSNFSYRSFRLDNCEFCVMSSDLRDCFGCVGLKKKRFCIFNKQYTEEEYWRIVDEIKSAMLERGEYGTYLPTALSTTFVPESGAVVYTGASPEELAMFGGNLFGAEDDGATGADRIDPSKARKREDIPDAIDDLTDEWVGVPIYDEVSKRTFTFLRPEVEHYRRLRVAPPNIHFIRRLHEVSHAGQVAAFEPASCTKCQQAVTIAKNIRYPHRRIYCRACYTAFVEKNG
ncbi:MAG: hypothetical protein AAB337_01815 [Patescibacteria group bacterium]